MLLPSSVPVPLASFAKYYTRKDTKYPINNLRIEICTLECEVIQPGKTNILTKLITNVFLPSSVSLKLASYTYHTEEDTKQSHYDHNY